MDKTLYCTGRYAVVDSFYRHIWINVYHEDLAHAIRRVFWSKAPTSVFDLTQFVNYSDDTVDSTVSLDWKIPEGGNRSHMIHPSQHNPKFAITHTTHTSDLLINEPNHSPAPPSLRLELQQQMILYFNILVRTLEFQASLRDQDHRKRFDAMLAQMDAVFQKEQSMADIRSGLYQLANSGDRDAFELPWVILRELDCLYA